MIIVVTVAAIALTSCSSSGQVAELEGELATANQIIDELEAELFAATSSTTTTTDPTPMIDITGSLSLPPNDYESDGKEAGSLCWGVDGYDDIGAGTDVVVRDGDGAIVGTSSLSGGEKEMLWVLSDCVFYFTVAVPSDSPFYEIEVSHRGGLAFSNEDMVRQEWTVAFSLR